MIILNNIRNNKNEFNLVLEKICIESLISDTVEVLYDNEMTYATIMNEAYKELNLQPENIKASIVKVIYNCHKLNTLTISDIIDNLNSEFLKAKIAFSIISPYSTQKVRYPKSGILNSDADGITGIIYIYVNQVFVNILKNLDIVNGNQQFNQLIEDLFKTYSHEITHVNQYDKQKKKQLGINNDQLQTSAQNLKYLMNPQEIDARARELANELLLTGKSFEDIKNMFNQNSKTLLKYPEYNSYWTRFGIYTKMHNTDLTRKQHQEKQEKIDVFKRFKRRVFDFILLDKQYINKGHLIYTLNNR